ncbi:uncharacterized protein LOC142175764 [Nicotiana tabacum]|uniref:Uncharacterized protein LOC142175764 n=1 Tax=Nicotiana tabacum TaxID=4097 RepID=A0AC58TNP9_TOBAC
MSIHEEDVDTQFTSLNAAQSANQAPAKSNYDVSFHELWDRCNAIVLVWIMNTISPNLLSTVIYASDAYIVWEDLREIFVKVNASRVAYLHKEIASLTQGVSSVSVYFSRLRELWDEYETLTPSPTCGCPESKKYVEHYQLQKLYQFLTGFNDSYENAKNQVLMTRPLPNLNQAYAMIINVESQKINRKGVYGCNDVNKADAMMSNRHYNNSGGFNNNGCPTNTGYTRGYKTKSSFNKPPIYCEYCRDKKVQNILHIPEFKYNLLSVSKITKELRCMVAFFHDFCVFQELFGGKVLGIGKEVLGLYILKAEDMQSPDQHLSPTVNTIVSSKNKCSSESNIQSCNMFSLWHKRLGHAPLKVVQKLHSLHDLHVTGDHCTVCPIAKQSRLPFHLSSSCSTSVFALVHADD